jgi:predicted alpha/beta-hydrolase family hydrolase
VKTANSSIGETKLFTEGSVYGCLHLPDIEGATDAVVLTHGAGADFEAPLLVVLASTLAAAGYFVLRCNLAFRQRKRSGPPHPSGGASDRQSLREAVQVMRRVTPGKVILGGHSYGGRQASMLAAEDRTVADSLLLLSYPLHPPAKPEALRTAHFPKLKVPALFVHGTKDGFGSVDEMREATESIPAAVQLSIVNGAGHDLARGRFDIQALILAKLASR